MSVASDKVTRVKTLVMNFQEQLASLLAPPDLGDHLPQREKAQIANMSLTQADSKLEELVNLSGKMADIVNTDDNSNAVELEGTAEEREVGRELRPGPVMVCGPPGTEPVKGHSQTRFDKRESLVYSRVSLDMSIVPGYIHKSGSLKSIPPKDTPSVTAEIFARPWSKKRELRTKPSTKYTYSSDSSFHSSCSSPVSDDTTFSFEDNLSPSSLHRLTRTRNRLKNRSGGHKSPSKSSAAAASSSVKPREQKTGKDEITSSVNLLNRFESDAMEVDVKSHKKVKKDRDGQPTSKQGKTGQHSDSDYSAEDDVVRTSQRVNRNRTAKTNGEHAKPDLIVSANDIDVNAVAANIDIFTSDDQEIASGTKPEPQLNTPRDLEVRNISLMSRKLSDSSLSSVYSNMPQLVDDLQETFNKESTPSNKKRDKKTADQQARKQLRSSSYEQSVDRGSSTEPVPGRDGKARVKLRKKPLVLVSKLNLEDIHQKKTVPPSPPPLSKPTIRITQADDKSSHKGSPLKTVRRSPTPHRGQRETPERLLRSGKSRVVNKSDTSAEDVPDISRSPKPEKSSDEKRSKLETSPRKLKKKENTESVLTGDDVSLSNDEVPVHYENINSSSPLSPERRLKPDTKEKLVTPHGKSPVKRTPVKTKRPVSQSRQNSDSDFDETPQKKKRRKIMERCSSEDEERPVVTPNSLTVRVSRKAASLQVSSEEPEGEDTSTLMDWESWEERKKKASPFKASKSGRTSGDVVKKEGAAGVNDAKDRKTAEEVGDVKSVAKVPSNTNDVAKEASDKKPVTKETSDTDNHSNSDDDTGEAQDSDVPSPSTAKGAPSKVDSRESSSASRLTSPEVLDDVNRKSRTNSPSGSAEYTVTFEGVKPDEEEDASDQEEFPAEIDCTACGKSIHWASQYVHNHPRLEVLICQRCNFTVNHGEFSLGETNEEYCSLCGDGGDIVLCDFCDKSFCQSCIARISGKDHLKYLLDDEAAEFTCYICDGEPLQEAKKLFHKFSEHLKRSKVPSIRACFKRKPKSGTVDSKGITDKQESADKAKESDEKKDTLDSKKKNKKKNKCSSRKEELTPAIVEDDETSSDGSKLGKKSPEVHTDDVMSDTNLSDEQAKREKRKKYSKTRNKDQKEEDGNSSKEDEKETSKDTAGDSSKQKKKSKKRRKNLLVRSSSHVENTGSSSSNNSDQNSNSRATSSSSSASEDLEEKKKEKSPSVQSDEEVKKKDSKAKKKSRIASYTSGSGSDSDEALQIEVSDHSDGNKDDGMLDPADDGSVKSVEYRIAAGDSDDSLDSLLTSDIELVQDNKKRRNPLKTVTTSSDEEEKPEEEKKPPKKRRTRKRKLENSSKDSDSDDFVDELMKGRNRKRRNRLKRLLSSDSDEEEDGDSNKDGDDEGDEVNESQEDPKGKKRRKIRKLIGEAKLASETKQALQEERERAERLKKRKQQTGEEEEDRLILEQDSETKEVKLEVRRSLVPNFKPHQREGIKFLYDACIETMDRVTAGRGTGAILAHCMGLGKTLQVIGFVDALLNKEIVNRVLILCPVNTIYNWKSEFLKWINFRDMDYSLYLIHEPNIRATLQKLRKWFMNGGVLFMGYERFRNLALCKRTKKAKQKAEMQKFLLNPGADLVVCDEGHVMRNSNSSTSISINQIKTRLRIVLTGTPLQNNLQEYYTMVNFVKPNLLGTPKEFKNRFVNPITNGQCRDSSAEDIRMMKHRAHVLYSLLKDSVQRKDYRVLTKTLPPKLEYVLNIRLSPVQDALYRRYLDNERGSGGLKSTSLFSTFAALAKIWNHPWVLKMDEHRRQEREERMELYGLSDDEEDDDDDDKTLGGFIVSDSDDDLYDNPKKKKKSKKVMKSNHHMIPGSSSSLSNSVSRTPTPLTPAMQNGPPNYISISSDSDPDLPKVKIKPEPGIVSTSNVAKTAESTRENGHPEEKNGSMQEKNGGRDDTSSKSMAWYDDLLGEKADEKLEMSGKLVFLYELLEKTRPLKEKVLVFSQSLLTLDLIEEFLSRPEWGDYIRAVDYCRLDGSSAADTRTSNMMEFNKIGNDRLRLFLISTRAGSLGVNLVAANRVVIFDACWNPSHDLQAIFRTYRYGQTKPVFIYRLLAQGTMEEKIYDRQVTKESLSMRVVDEKQIGRHFTANDLAELFQYSPAPPPDPNDAKSKEEESIENDMVLNAILEKIRHQWVVSYHHHDSLLEHIDQEELTEEERKVAWEQYKQQMNMENARYNMEVLQNSISSFGSTTAQPQQGGAGPSSGGMMGPSTSAGPSQFVPPPAASAGGGYQVNPYDTFKVKNVTGLVSQALHQVNQIKVNYNNLQQLKRVCASLVPQAVPQVHRDQMNRLQMLVNQGTQELHGKIQLINDAIARFQASPLAMHPPYTSEVNRYRQTLYKALEELRVVAGGGGGPTYHQQQQQQQQQQQPPRSSSSNMHRPGPPPNVVIGNGNGQARVTSTTDFM